MERRADWRVQRQASVGAVGRMGEVIQGERHRGGQPGGHSRRLVAVLVLVALYMVLEVAGGLLTGSLALLADAAHMLSDAGALGLALFATWFASRPAPRQRTYGHYRVEILAALANGATLVAISIYIFIEAVQRVLHPPSVLGAPMMLVAGGGLIVNAVGLWLLAPGRAESLNLRGAWLHVLTDMLGSIQAIVAGAAIWAFGWTWTDPVASILIAVLVVYSAKSILWESVSVLMEAAPANIDVDAVTQALLGVPGVVALHDLHVWAVTSSRVALSVHLVAPRHRHQEILPEVRDMLRLRFGIAHSTIQLETSRDGPAGDNRS